MHTEAEDGVNILMLDLELLKAEMENHIFNDFS